MWLELLVAATAVFASSVWGSSGISAAKRKWAATSPIQSFKDWRRDYGELIKRARALQREREGEAAASGTVPRRIGWKVSPRQAWRDIQAMTNDPHVKRLFAETFKRTPWVLVAVILVVSLLGSYIVIRRASLLAQLFDLLLTHAGSSAVAAAAAGATAAAATATGSTVDASPLVAQPATPAAAPPASAAAAAAADVWHASTLVLVEYVVMHLADHAIDIIAGLLTDELRSRIELRARRAFFAAILSQDVSYLDSKRHTDLQRHLQEAPFAIHDAALVPARVCRYAFTLIAGLWSMWHVDWQLTIIAWVLRAPLSMNVSAFTNSVISLHWLLAEDMSSRGGALMGEAIQNVRLVQLYGAEDVEASAYGALLAEGYRSTSTLKVIEKIIARTSGMLHLAFDVGTLAFAVRRILQGHLTVGTFNAFKSYQSAAASAFEGLLHETNRLRQSARKCEAFFDIVDRKPSILSLPDGSVADAEFSAYNDDQSLTDLLHQNDILTGYGRTRAVAEAMAGATNGSSKADAAGGGAASASAASDLDRKLPAALGRGAGMRACSRSTSDGGSTDGSAAGDDAMTAAIGTATASSIAASAATIAATSQCTARVATLLSSVPSYPEPADDTDCDASITAAATSTSVAPAAAPAAPSPPTPPLLSPASMLRRPRAWRIRGDVSFDHVSFKYPRTLGNTDAEGDALTDMSFHIPAGSTAAFVGSSGSGKSTIFRLLVRFYDAKEGRVLIDGGDIRELDARELRRQIGFIEQEPAMLNRSIAENIAYGFDPRSEDYPTQEQIVQAAKHAFIHDAIMSFPDGYKTVVGERGLRLSTGEKQRISIARAFIRDPSILLCDETTASLDAEAEVLVTAGIQALMRGRTVIMIAHRLRTVQDADQLFVLSHGKIIERGRHAQLLSQNGRYAELVTKQMIRVPGADEEEGDAATTTAAAAEAAGGAGATSATAGTAAAAAVGASTVADDVRHATAATGTTVAASNIAAAGAGSA